MRARESGRTKTEQAAARTNRLPPLQPGWQRALVSGSGTTICVTPTSSDPRSARRGSVATDERGPFDDPLRDNGPSSGPTAEAASYFVLARVCASYEVRASGISPLASDLTAAACSGVPDRPAMAQPSNCGPGLYGAFHRERWPGSTTPESTAWPAIVLAHRKQGGGARPVEQPGRFAHIPSVSPTVRHDAGIEYFLPPPVNRAFRKPSANQQQRAAEPTAAPCWHSGISAFVRRCHWVRPFSPASVLGSRQRSSSWRPEYARTRYRHDADTLSSHPAARPFFRSLPLLHTKTTANSPLQPASTSTCLLCIFTQVISRGGRLGPTLCLRVRYDTRDRVKGGRWWGGRPEQKKAISETSYTSSSYYVQCSVRGTSTDGRVADALLGRGPLHNPSHA
ncbi:hypothetical protein CMQ_5104 [Grosmannia clavigera kw1407]|uniref:Uncharacterized protein n=1 Tax=Grosmannia clavigera (strain kw1407 / UAMH 11150) TaxID=655863 RepID=F0XBP9_GROCL|nr:uncharacterized protein CMQ_5104 [Grosmannia clavigera kw1407]EFX04842.1 hypothetical protein CMQ_5104 [Grosmannia clavigera kw1407]